MTAAALHPVDRTGRPLPIEALRELWPLGGWQAVTAVPGGKNDHYRLDTGHGAFYLRRSHRQKPRAELAAQLDLVRLLVRRGLPAPEPVPTRSGEDHAVVDGRLWTLTRAIEGHRYDDASLAHLHRLGETLAHYHRLTGDLDGGTGPPRILAELRVHQAAPDLPAKLREAQDRVVAGLLDLAPGLPRAMIHGGARRGSLLFREDRVVGVLDFDSSRRDVRVMDLAVATHDVGKIYTDRASDNKLRLDLSRVRALLAAYARDRPLCDEEVAALPLLLEAKRLKRVLGRLQRTRSGEALSVNDLAKIELEQQRLAWLDEHRSALDAAVREGVRDATSPRA